MLLIRTIQRHTDALGDLAGCQQSVGFQGMRHTLPIRKQVGVTVRRLSRIGVARVDHRRGLMNQATLMSTVKNPLPFDLSVSLPPVVIKAKGAARLVRVLGGYVAAPR